MELWPANARLFLAPVDIIEMQRSSLGRAKTVVRLFLGAAGPESLTAIERKAAPRLASATLVPL